MCDLSDLFDAVLKGQFSQGSGALHRLAVVFGAPAGAVDVDVVRSDPQGPGLHDVRHVSVQHANTCTPIYKL